MRTCYTTLAARRAASLTLLITMAGLAQAQTSSAGVYRCGNAYSSTPCPGGKAVAADDARNEAQRQQAQAVKQQDARLARDLAAERRTLDQASTGQRAARIGPSAAERAHADALAAKRQSQVEAKANKAKKKRHKPKKLDAA